ncbi:MAG: rRNA pseudouridine synthase [Ruminococcaceae bacterium]|nr:rRNA pseudouridine synthase [Oscillospiraceae bacterium]
MRLDKFLCDAGIGSRKDIKKLIKSGDVRVEGRSKVRPEDHIDPKSDEVFFGGKKILYKEFIYLMMNKPQGYISATFDKRLPTVLDIVPEEFAHYDLFPAGRLDIDTEGLLLLTNDGQLAHNILSPKKHIPKTYFARVSGRVTPKDIEAFKNGVIIDGDIKTKPAVLEILLSDEISEINLTITEGKFHQVKRMFEAVGKEVIYLKRIKMNKLSLDDTLALGETRELNETEIELIKEGI